MADASEYLNNPDWVHRIEQLFVLVDLNKNGYMELKDWELWVDNIVKAVNPDAALVAKLLKNTREYCAGLGLTPGKRTTKEEFIKDFAAFAAAERSKKQKGQEPLLFKLNHSWYDVVDTNHDGHVTLEEYRKVCDACNFDASAADAAFKVIDKNKNGKIERSELNEHEFKYWFELNDAAAESTGMFGDTFEKK